MQRLSEGRSAHAAPELSVLLPYRDAEATLAEALDSVLSQRGCTLELIAIDDGSSDGGARLVAEYAERDPRVVTVRTDGVGIPRALNLGLSVARAPLIARMDADDVCLPERFAKQLHTLHERPELAVLGSCVEAFPSAQLAEGMQRYVAWQNGLLSAADHRMQLFVESPLCHPSVVMRKSALLAIDGYRDGPFPEDYDLWLRFDAAGYGMAKLPEVLLRWRQSPRCATRSDPRYARASFTPLKAPHLAARLKRSVRAIDVWGAGQTGRRLARGALPRSRSAQARGHRARSADRAVHRARAARRALGRGRARRARCARSGSRLSTNARTHRG